MRISDWSSDVCSSDLHGGSHRRQEYLGIEGKEVGIAPGGIKVDVHRVVEQHIDAAEFGHCRRDHAIEIIGVADIDGERDGRSEEHTSELQSLMRISYAVFCLKKKIETIQHYRLYQTLILITERITMSRFVEKS